MVSLKTLLGKMEVPNVLDQVSGRADVSPGPLAQDFVLNL